MNANAKRMKQRKERNNSKLIHVSFDEVEKFIPRIPKQICPNEDNTTPRICVAQNVLCAIQAMPQGGEVIYYMARLGVPVVVHASSCRSKYRTRCRMPLPPEKCG